MDDKNPAPFALPPEQQIFGTGTEVAQPQTPAEPQKRRRGRPAKVEGAPKVKRQGRKPAVAVASAIDMLDQIKVLRGLNESEFGVVMTIMKQVPKDSWGNIGRALVELVQL